MDSPDMDPKTVEPPHPWIIGFAPQELLTANLTRHELQQASAEIIKRPKTMINLCHCIRSDVIFTDFASYSQARPQATCPDKLKKKFVM